MEHDFCEIGGIDPAPPCTLVIFGGSGDLTRRKLLPSLYNMVRNGMLNEHFAVLGLGSTALDDESFRQRLDESAREFAGTTDSSALARLRNATYYLRGRFSQPEPYKDLRARLDEISKRHGTGGNIIYYLAIPPEAFGATAEHLREHGLVRRPDDPGGWTRLIVEKPFGRDLESAQKLNQELLTAFHERQIHRIDHYLGKETVQNILLLRFANGIFEPIWNRRYIDHVQITVAETLGVEGRGAYYETAGSLRDVLQNHMFQLLCMVAMEPPTSLEAEAVRNEKLKVLEAIRPFSPDDIRTRTVRGQYGRGTIDGKPVPAYREEPNVSPTSNVDTFSAVQLFVENWRLADVPFYLRTGKRLPIRDTEITIQFRRAPLTLLRGARGELPQNRLTIHIQPDERITIRMHAKCPGPVIRLAPVELAFAFNELEGTSRSTGYETLLYDCMIGDRLLFQRADMVEAAWRIATPILQEWEAKPPTDFPNYPAGTWGPPAADELLRRDGRHWFAPVRA